MAEKHPVKKALEIFDFILNDNIQEHIRTNHVVIDEIKRYFEERRALMVQLYEEVNGNPNIAFKKLTDYDSYHAQHGRDVELKCMEITQFLKDYDFDVNLPDSARLHDFGKIIFPNELKFKETVLGEKLQDYEKDTLRYGHVIAHEVLGNLCGLHPAIIHAGTCHHDKHHKYPYPHKSIDRVLEIPFELNPKEYQEKHDKELIKNSTDIIIIGNDIISLSDTVCSMRDKKRPTNDPTNVYKEILERASKGCYNKNLIEAFLKSEGIDKQEIDDLFLRYKPEDEEQQK